MQKSVIAAIMAAAVAVPLSSPYAQQEGGEWVEVEPSREALDLGDRLDQGMGALQQQIERDVQDTGGRASVGTDADSLDVRSFQNPETGERRTDFRFFNSEEKQ